MKTIFALILSLACVASSIGVYGRQKFYGGLAAHQQAYYDVAFVYGPAAGVVLKSNKSGMEFIVLDANGNIVCRDSGDKTIYDSFKPAYTGVFRIVVINRGDSYSSYTLSTN